MEVSPFFGPIGQRDAAVDDGFLATLGYYIGKPEEWLTKAIGSMFSDAARYNFGADDPTPASFWQQEGFGTLITRESGLHPLAGAGIGLALSVFNPLDPLNYIGVGQLTKAGKFAQNLNKLGKAGRMIQKGDMWLNRVDDLLDIAKAERKAGRVTKSTRSALREARALRQDLIHMQLPKGEGGLGMDLTKLIRGEAPTGVEAFERGHRTFLSTDLDNNPLVRMYRDMRKHKGGPKTPITMPEGMATRLAKLRRGAPNGPEFPASRLRSRALRNPYNLKILPDSWRGSIAKLGVNFGGGLKGWAARVLKKNYAGTVIPETHREKMFLQVIKNAEELLQGDIVREESTILNMLQRTYDELVAEGIEPDDVAAYIQEVARKLDELSDHPQPIEELRAFLTKEEEMIQAKITDPGDHDGMLFGPHPGSPPANVVKWLEPPKAPSPAIGKATAAIVEDSTDLLGAPLHGVTSTGENIRITDNLVVVEVGPLSREHIRGLNKLEVPGIPRWRDVPVKQQENVAGKFTASDKVLVGEWNKGIQSPGTAQTWLPAHQKNLETMAAMLAQEKWAFVNLEPSDFMVGADGTITLINPRKLVPVKAKKTANIESMNELRQLNDRVADLPRYGYDALADGGKSRGLAVRGKNRKNAWEFSAWQKKPATADEKKAWGRRSQIPAATVVAKANNAGWITELDPKEFAANGVDRARKVLEETGRMEPVIYQVDPLGNVEIIEGSDRLAAAYLIGKETGVDPAIPVQREPWLGMVDEEAPSNFVVKDPTTIEPENLSEVLDTPGVEIEGFSKQFVLVHADGNPLTYSRGDIANELTGDMVGATKTLFTRGASSIGHLSARERQSVRATMQAAWRSLVLKLGPSDLHHQVVLTKLGEQADDLGQFLLLLKQETGVDFSDALIRAARNNPESLKVMDGLFLNQVQKPAREQGEAWRRLGLVFDTPYSKRRIAHEGVVNGDLLMHVGDDGVIHVKDLRGRGMAPTTKKVADALEMHAGNLNPKTQVLIHSGDEVQHTFVSKLRGGKDVLTEPVKPSRARFMVHDRARQALKRNGILIDPKAAEAKEVFGESFGVMTQSSVSSFSFTRNEDAALIIAGDGRTVENLWDDVFGEGSVPIAEYGVAGPTGIYLSNIQGKEVRTITKRELAPFRHRLYKLAQRLQKAGFAENFIVHFDLPFEVNGAKDLLKKEVWTLGDIINARGNVFVRTLPDHLNGVPARPPKDVLGPGSLVLRHEQVDDPILRKLVKYFADHQNVSYLDEVQAGLNVRYREKYFARLLNPKLKTALDDMAVSFFKHSGVLDVANKHMKGRVFSDLTTDEVNDLFKTLQDKAREGVNVGLENFHNYGVAHDSKFMKALAQEAPDLIDFFITDPFRAAFARRVAARKSVRTANMIEELSQFAVFRGTPKEFAEQSNAFTEAARYANDVVEKKIQELETLKQNIAGLPPEEAAQFDSRIDRLAKEIADGHVKVHELAKSNKLNDKLNILEWNKYSKTVYIPLSDARKLVEAGKLEAGAIVGSPSSGLIGIDARIVKTSGGDLNTLMVFDEELGQILENYLGISQHPGPFLAFYDKVLNIWKQWTLFPIPKYHIRNFLSNVLLGWMGGMRNWEPMNYAGKAQKHFRKFTQGKLSLEEYRAALKEIVIHSDYGSRTMDEVWDLFVDHGGLSGGLHYNEMRVYSQEVTSKMHSLGMLKSSELIATDPIYNLTNKVLQRPRAFAANMENNFRLGAFIDGLQKGMSAPDAALHMKKIFYDYGNLNAFERNVMRRMVPFYSWMRHNIPRMITTMITEPTKHYRIMQLMKNAQVGAGGPPANESEIPEWLRNKWNFVVERDDKGNLGVMTAEGIIPMVDAYRLLFSKQSDSALFGPVVEAFDMATESLTPILKVPMENIMNKSLYSGRPIERIAGEPARSKLLSSLGFSRRSTSTGELGIFNLLANEEFVSNVRVFKSITKLLDDHIIGGQNIRGEIEPTTTMQLFDFFVGALYQVDPDRALAWERINQRALMRQAKAFIKRGRKQGRADYEKFGRARMLQLSLIGSDEQ